MKLTALMIALAVSARAASFDEAPSLAADLIRNARFASAMAQGANRPAADLTALQKHVAFFDANNDGIITVSETVLGLRRLGLGRIKAEATGLVINLALGPKTSGHWTTDVSVAGIRLGKHGSDTGVFDAQGRFVPEAFERIFSTFDLDHSGSMSETELAAMTDANSKLRPGGGTASSQEFKLLLLVAADTTVGSGGKKIPALSRERLLRFYDGTLFYTLAKPVD